jgi:prepilin-type N-terminal cleavage/methylation domain-containing protein
MIKTSNHRAKSEAGFTIVELMIATVVFSVILVIASSVMIHVNNLYYKGVTQIKLQDEIRGLNDELTRRLQLNTVGPTQVVANDITFNDSIGVSRTISAYCIGNVRYSFIKNTQIGSDTAKGQINHVLWRDTAPVGQCAPADLRLATPSANGTEMLGQNNWLTEFSISPLSTPYNIAIAVAYGDQDLLNFSGAATTCKNGVGDQFCAYASLATLAEQRLNPVN